MSYAPSPRPTFVSPTAIPYASVTRHLWGDDESGEVADWIYVSSDQIHQLVFALPPGGAFQHSDAYRTIFAADEVLYVLSGTMVLANPETGEVHRIAPGEAAFFRRDTWHHAWNWGTDDLRVLELFSPPPSQGTSGSYARTKPLLPTIRYHQDQWLGRWPEEAEQARRADTIHVIRPHDLRWRLEGQDHPALVGLFVSTEHITVGKLQLLPGQRTDGEIHGGAESLYVLDGPVHVRTPDCPPPSLFELHTGDGFYVPQGIAHQYYNFSDHPVEIIFGVAPAYSPGSA